VKLNVILHFGLQFRFKGFNSRTLPILRISEHLSKNLSQWGDCQTNCKTMFYLLSFNTLIYFRNIQHDLVFFYGYFYIQWLLALSLLQECVVNRWEKNVFFHENMKNAIFEWPISNENYLCKRVYRFKNKNVVIIYNVSPKVW
jgi:hypothetical protein